MATGVRGFENPTIDINAVRALRACSHPLSEPHDLQPLIERIGDARYVLLGDCSHGTAESYAWRARLSQRLIQEKGFSFIAVEGDWPDCYKVHRYALGERKLGYSARELLRGFHRWPTWLWANEEVVAFVEWLRLHNERRPKQDKVGFYGLDVYGLWESLHFLDKELRQIDPCLHEEFRRVHGFFSAFDQEAPASAQTSLVMGRDSAQHIAALLEQLRERTAESVTGDDAEDTFPARQNAYLLQHGEEYYRTMLRGGAVSWNNRDTHMADTLERLARHRGENTRAIVWAHNSHIGDARYCEMNAGGMVNLGQIMRERCGEDDAILIGCAFHRGRVIAGSAWDAPWEDVVVPPARQGSWETHLHAACPHDALFIWGADQAHEAALLSERGHRAIGFVYHPEFEDACNYVPTVLSRRYDALCYFDETHALHPLHVKPHHDAFSPAV